MNEIREAHYYIKATGGYYKSPRNYSDPMAKIWLGMNRGDCFHQCGAGKNDKELNTTFSNPVELLASVVNEILRKTKSSGYVHETLGYYLSEYDGFVNHLEKLVFYEQKMFDGFVDQIPTALSAEKAKAVWSKKVFERAKDLFYWEFIYSSNGNVNACEKTFCEMARSNAVRGIIFVSKEDFNFVDEDEAEKRLKNIFKYEVQEYSNWALGNILDLYFNHDGTLACALDEFDESHEFYGSVHEAERELKENYASFRGADIIISHTSLEKKLPNNIYEIACPLKHKCDEFRETVEKRCSDTPQGGAQNYE